MGGEGLGPHQSAAAAASSPASNSSCAAARKSASGPLIVASKHQSAWETFALLPLFDNPPFILKRELQWIPFFGWLLVKGRMVPVDRGAGSQALVEMTERARIELARGRQLIIFPEGTRRPAGAEPRYKYGVAHLYAAAGVPCLPVALNSGVFWPRRRSLMLKPGTVVVEILDPITPGLDKDVFFKRAAGRDRDGAPRAPDRGGRCREPNRPRPSCVALEPFAPADVQTARRDSLALRFPCTVAST